LTRVISSWAARFNTGFFVSPCTKPMPCLSQHRSSRPRQDLRSARMVIFTAGKVERR